MDLENFVVIVEFEVKPEHLQKFNELVAINARASVQKEPGCHQFDVVYQPDAPHLVTLYEIYENAAAFTEHLALDHTRTFLAAAKELVVKQSSRRLLRSLAPSKAG